ncbi:MAG: extracellular ligand-binding receptor [Noviherbaspirillum sp.]|jgi:branched-chain amino acid transport system substrate-binding protein|nr:extracellular ligand-binding receptor [Noviherbaspirillum sp.]
MSQWHIKKAAILVSLCTAFVTATAADNPRGAASGEPYKIGGLLASTGRLASMGNDQKEGMMVAQKVINAAGGINGRPIQVIFEDMEGDPAKAISLAKKLVGDDKVIGITGLNTEAGAAAIREYMDRSEVPFFGASTQPGFTDGFNYAFALVNDSIVDTRIIAEQIAKRGWKRVGILYEANNPYGVIQYEGVKKVSEQLGGTVLGAKFQSADQDLMPVWLNIKEHKPDVVFIAGSSYAPGATALRNRRAAGLGNVPVVMSIPYQSAAFVKLAGPNAEGVYFGGYYKYGNLPAGSKRLFDAMEQSFPGKFVSAHHGLGWDGVHILAAAAKAAGPDGKKMKTWIENLRGYEGARGTFNFAPNQHRADVPVRVVQWTKGAWKDVTSN